MKPFRRIECLWCHDTVLTRNLQWHFINRCNSCPQPEVDKRICSRCQRQLPISQFAAHVGRAQGRGFTCGDCNRSNAIRWRETHPDVQGLNGEAARPASRVMKPCPYCGTEHAARMIWNHRSSCPQNPKNMADKTVLLKKRPNGVGVEPSLRDYKLKRRKLTTADYTRILAGQGGGCAICGATTATGGNSKQRYLSVDHCHTTGSNRGLLCPRCNWGLGHFRDDPALLIKASLYLAKYKPPDIVS